MAQLMLDLAEGRRLKQEGMDLTASVNSFWISSSLADLRDFAKQHREFPMEAYRAYRKLRGLPGPNNHHAWGAFVHAAVRAGVITWTGRYIQAASTKTHAHPVKVWRG